MKFKTAFNEFTIHAEADEQNTNQDEVVVVDPAELASMTDHERQLNSVLDQQKEINEAVQECDKVDRQIALATEAYKYCVECKEKGKTLSTNDLILVQAQLKVASENCGIDISDLKSSTASFKTFAENDIYTAFEVMAEDLSSTLAKMFDMIKNLIIKIADMIRSLFTKLLILYPILQTNLNKLVTFLMDRRDQPKGQIDREQLRWVANKAPAIFALVQEPAGIINFLQRKRRLVSIGSIYQDGLDYGQAILDAKRSNASEQEIVNRLQKVTNDILNTPDKSIYANLRNILPEFKDEDGKICIYRADGRTIKYRVLTTEGEEQGLPIIKSSIKSIGINPINEEQIIIGKVYSLEEVVSIAREDMSYISGIRVYYKELTSIIDSAKKMVNGMEGLMKGTTSNVTLTSAMMRNFYSLSKTGLGLLNSDMLMGYYNTARDIYYAMYKYADLWFGTPSDPDNKPANAKK